MSGTNDWTRPEWVGEARPGSRPRAELVDAAELARRTGTVQRALVVSRSRAMAADEGDEYAASVPYGLELYLPDAPFGAWK